MTWSTDWLSAFGLFTRPMKYSRGGAEHTVQGFSVTVKTDEVVGDFNSTTCKVTIAAPVLQAAGLFPPEEFDRVDIGDGIPRTVSQIHIDYVQNVAQWCRLVVSG